MYYLKLTLRFLGRNAEMFPRRNARISPSTWPGRSAGSSPGLSAPKTPYRSLACGQTSQNVFLMFYFFILSYCLFGSESNVSQVTKKIAKKVCKARGSEKCISIPRQVTVDVPKSIDKKVCRLLLITFPHFTYLLHPSQHPHP